VATGMLLTAALQFHLWRHDALLDAPVPVDAERVRAGDGLYGPCTRRVVALVHRVKERGGHLRGVEHFAQDVGRGHRGLLWRPSAPSIWGWARVLRAGGDRDAGARFPVLADARHAASRGSCRAVEGITKRIIRPREERITRRNLARASCFSNTSCRTRCCGCSPSRTSSSISPATRWWIGADLPEAGQGGPFRWLKADSARLVIEFGRRRRGLLTMGWAFRQARRDGAAGERDGDDSVAGGVCGFRVTPKGMLWLI